MTQNSVAVTFKNQSRQKRLQQPSVKGRQKVQHFVHKMMFSLTRLCLLVFLVCLLATSRKNYWADFHANFTKDLFLDREDITINVGTNHTWIIKFRKVKNFNRVAVFIVYHCKPSYPTCRCGLQWSGAIYSWWRHCLSLYRNSINSPPQ